MTIVFCDGASNPHTKRSGIGVVWFQDNQFHNPNNPTTLLPHQKPYKILSEEIFSPKGHPTNNEAEYRSLVRALEESEEEPLKIFMDSKLVVNQVNGQWNINYPHLLKLKEKVISLNKNFTLRHVRRHYNTHADDASKQCLKKPSHSFFDQWER